MTDSQCRRKTFLINLNNLQKIDTIHKPIFLILIKYVTLIQGNKIIYLRADTKNGNARPSSDVTTSKLIFILKKSTLPIMFEV